MRKPHGLYEVLKVAFTCILATSVGQQKAKAHVDKFMQTTEGRLFMKRVVGIVHESAGVSLGDSLEWLLKGYGSLSQAEIIKLFMEHGIKVSEKNPHTVIANVVSRDTKKRFKRLKDKRVALAKNNHT